MLQMCNVLAKCALANTRNAAQQNVRHNHQAAFLPVILHHLVLRQNRIVQGIKHRPHKQHR